MDKTIVIEDEVWTEAKLEKQLLASMYTGMAVANENAAGHLRLLAGNAFSRGDDTKAQIIRSLALEFDCRAISARTQQKDMEK